MSARTKHRGPGFLDIPMGKLSETILDFGKPLLDRIDEEGPTLDAMRNALMIVIAVWNAHVMAMPVWGKPEHLANLRALPIGLLPDGTNPVDALDERRAALFAADPRLVGDWSIDDDGRGGHQFRCDTLLPKHLVRKA